MTGKAEGTSRTGGAPLIHPETVDEDAFKMLELAL
ncbi:hypothetical protein MYMAC_003964 [Corallococcus macrosporus DSM 14697]|uniref:Uncharacterized protein n=1 Tax=Corallococcus macrosporus DSM 14697 TaxID=1189310 RepID=A0A250JXE1_9BACT|nr:hypothetical protein MYMAC_003964 [Corallococcus macrosporus DSM 14697]